MLRKSWLLSIVAIFSILTGAMLWYAYGQEKTLSRADWAPSKGSVVFPHRGRAEIELTWDKKVPAATDNSLEVELILPDWKRGLLDRSNSLLVV